MGYHSKMAQNGFHFSFYRDGGGAAGRAGSAGSGDVGVSGIDGLRPAYKIILKYGFILIKAHIIFCLVPDMLNSFDNGLFL